MKKHIPNTITSLNLVFGILAILMAVEGHIDLAAYAVFLAAVMDFLDGLAARLLKVYSEIGKQLDSLADLVSFGVAPSIIVWKMIQQSSDGLVIGGFDFLGYTVVLMPLFAALRLAKFNVDDSQEKSFSGLPVPGNAIFFAGLALNWVYFQGSAGLQGWLSGIAGNGFVMASMVVLFSGFMAMPVRLFSLKFEGLSLKENGVRYVFILLSILLILFFGLAAIPLCIVLYLLTAIISGLFWA